MANAIVVVAGIATTTAVAMLIGPPMFRRLMDAGVPQSTTERPYERAFRDATAWSVGIALGMSALAALALSWYLSRRVHRSATQLSQAATAVAQGRYAVRVPPPRLGHELDAVSAAFNRMAEQLGAVESTRRQLLSDLAHEIRTPVSVLEAYLEALEDGVQRLDPDTISLLRDQTRRLARFTVDVTALTTSQQGAASIAPTSVSPASLIATAAAAFADRYRAKGVALVTDVRDDVPQLWADSDRLGQVLGNLLDNALRHTSLGGRVVVSADGDPDVLTIVVADDGDGVAAEHLPYLFERFYRADKARDRAHGGAGIGLAIAKALVEAHRGGIEVSSDGLGTGAKFAITLPTARSHTAETQPEPVNPP
jgi:two-component system sensor histidine kinase BaeS